MKLNEKISVWLIGSIAAIGFAIPAVSHAASLSGSLQLTDGTPIHSGFSVSIGNAVSAMIKPIGLNGTFSFSSIPVGTSTLRVISPWRDDAPVDIKSFTLQASDEVDAGVLHPPKSWIHATIVRPDQSEISTNLNFSIDCQDANVYIQMNAFQGSLIAVVPPNALCSISAIGTLTSEQLINPDSKSVQTAATGTVNAGLLMGRAPNLIGTVTQKNGSPISIGISALEFRDAGYHVVSSTMSDASGTFIAILKPGEYFLYTKGVSNEFSATYGAAPPLTKVTIPADGSAVQMNLQLHAINVHGFLTDVNGVHLTEYGNVRFTPDQGNWFEINVPKDGTLNQYITPGTYRVRSIGSNHYSSTRIMTIAEETSNVDFVVGYSKGPFIASGTRPDIRAQLKSTNVKTISNDTLGLNVHLGLAKEIYDDAFMSYLETTKTKWVREIFLATQYASANSSPRFNMAINRYRDEGINVVGILAYHPSQGEKPKDLKAWAKYVQTVVHTYKSYVRVWEIWNEPNYTHLQPPDVAVYAPLFGIAGKIIREEDPNAVILNGGLSWPDAKWAAAFLGTTEAKKYLDQFAFHVYYCDQYAKYGDNRMLVRDLGKLKAVLDKYKPGKRAWITEMGCSRGTIGVNESLQVKYTLQTVPWLLQQGWIEKILWFTITDNTFGDPYEDQFGLLKKNFNMNELGKWYTAVNTGQTYTPPASKTTTGLIYGKKRLSPISREATKATELKNRIAKSYKTAAKKSVAIRTWQKLVNAYIYGGYPVSAIARQIDTPSKVIVHATKPYSQWKK
ncbi:MAG: glycosyl hydrolase [Patescibacteria group bacterium]